MKYLVKNAEIFEFGYSVRADILIESGMIKRIESGIADSTAQVISAEGCAVLPLFIDLHAHLRTPGQEHKEDLRSGLSAALAGGFHTVVCMPNTRPPVDRPELVTFLLKSASVLGLSSLKVAAAMTENLEGKKKAPLKALSRAGACGFSDDGNAIQSSRLMYEIMREASELDRPLFLHEEDYELSNRSCINEGRAAYLTGQFGNSPLSESLPVLRDVILSEKTGSRIHIQHVSSKTTVDFLRQFKTGLVTAEVTPHHLLFDEEQTASLDPYYKTNPPLRSKSDRESLIEAAKEGIIDCIATDHAPHATEEKEMPYEAASPGMSWFEIAFPALYSLLVEKGIFGFSDIVRLMNVNPARILGIERPEIKEGKQANFAIFDISTKKRLKNAYSKARNNPLFGSELYGFPRAVFKDGRLMVVEGRLTAGEEV